jgi:type III restriction enzyme
VLRFHQRQIANLVHEQMRPHSWEKASSYEAKVSQGFIEVHSQAFAAAASELVRPFDRAIDHKSDIRQMLFGGFRKCLYPTQKFDSDPERRFAVVLEKDSTVSKWFKPGKKVFQIHYNGDDNYEPDFVVETETEKLLCEPKRADQMQDPIVLAKARAAVTWCANATSYETQNKGKPWRYLLIPHDAIAENMTIAGLARSYEFRG